MTTSTIVLQAFILAALIYRLVLEFRTIGLLVAHLGQWNTHTAAAIELRFRITFDRWTFC